MPPRKKAASGNGTSMLAAHNFLPTLTKPMEIIGDYIAMQGKDWTGCPSADKEKHYRCIVRKFKAMHNFGTFKSAAFEVQEMGESGEGSLEPGVASGEKFYVVYLQPFLNHHARCTTSCSGRRRATCRTRATSSKSSLSAVASQTRT
jgi:hypothetical protein